MNNFKISLVDFNEILFSDFENQYVFSEKDLEFEYNPFAFESIQLYNPILSTLSNQIVKGDSQIMNQQYFFNAPDSIINIDSREVFPKSMFIKYSPLLDVYSYLIGKYEKDSSLNILPSLNTEECFKKYNSPHSISYVDSFFCYLSGRMFSERKIVNAIDYYGSFVGIQKIFKTPITEDVEYLNKCPYFISNVNTKFKIDHEYYKSYRFNGSNTNRPKLCMDSRSSRVSIGAEEIDVFEEENNNILSDIQEEIPIECDTFPADSFQDNVAKEEDGLIYERNAVSIGEVEEDILDDKNSDDSSESSSPAYCADSDSELNYSSEDEDDLKSTKSEDWTTCSESEEEQNSEVSLSDRTSDSSNEDDSEDTEDGHIVAYIPKYPVQMICLEKCEGTLDRLLSKREVNEEKGGAYLMQIIMVLLAYQTAFQFTHNDLHTNNIMYVSTDKEYLVYKYEHVYYLVPTFGKIMKIIDFGRSIYRVNGVVYCSDSFSKDGDAYGQYNTEPFMNQNKPRIDPNYSFDLCRLGCSMYDFIIDHDEAVNDDSQLDDFQKTIVRWCSDDNGKNVLYKKSGEERYPDFKLYKMIARGVHKHTPYEQLKFPFFSKYEISANDLEKMILAGEIAREDIMIIA